MNPILSILPPRWPFLWSPAWSAPTASTLPPTPTSPTSLSLKPATSLEVHEIHEHSFYTVGHFTGGSMFSIMSPNDFESLNSGENLEINLLPRLVGLHYILLFHIMLPLKNKNFYIKDAFKVNSNPQQGGKEHWGLWLCRSSWMVRRSVQMEGQVGSKNSKKYFI